MIAATISATAETMTLTSFGMRTSVRSRMSVPRTHTNFGIGPLVHAHGRRRRLVGPARMAAQILLQVTGIIAVEQRADEPAVEVRRAEQPIGNRERQVHVGLHHQPAVVMRGVMAAQRIDEGTVADEPVLVDMAAELHELENADTAGGQHQDTPTEI